VAVPLKIALLLVGIGVTRDVYVVVAGALLAAGRVEVVDTVVLVDVVG
jgi:hypothetical protein